MNFIDDEHKKFWEEQYRIMQKYGKNDVYYKSIVYTLGICPMTRENFNKIFDLKEGCININSINSAWQTGSSEKVTRLAFSLWNRCNYDSTQDFDSDNVSKHYNVSEIFCCSYAPYFFEAVKIRYPEYTRIKEEQQRNRAGIYTSVENIEQVEYDVDEKIENKEEENIVAIYIRTNQADEDKANESIYHQRDELENYCKKNNIVNRVHYIDIRKSGTPDDRKALDRLVEDLKLGKIKQIIVTDISKLYREPIKILELFSNDYMKKVNIKSLTGEIIDKKYCNAILEKVSREIKRKNITERQV